MTEFILQITPHRGVNLTITVIPQQSLQKMVLKKEKYQTSKRKRKEIVHKLNGCLIQS